ncbi:MAG: amidohydrolase [Candidatus Pacebacteria bacterium]|jgi:5-methylthioadenosine/S-adenosylhomocysteine deaminase|nr:amidohydrolase [Candidatus Paceibacterota bacterium]
MDTNNNFTLPLVNAHAHAAMVGFRGLAEDLPLEVWLNEHIFPAERARVTPAFVYEQTKAAIAEMRANRVGLFRDMYFFEDEAARAAEEMGMAAVVGEGILDFPTPSAANSGEALEATEKLIAKYRASEYIKVAVSPHAIYTVSEATLLKCKKLADKYGTLLHIHLAETKKEFDDCQKTNHCSPVEYIDRLGLLDERALLAHCVWVTDHDIEIIARRKANVAHCPLSNLKLGSGIAPVEKMLKAGINVCLGTDGAASSNRLDVWEAAKFAALLQKGVNCDAGKIPAKEAIRMATANGMKALGFGRIGGVASEEVESRIENAADFNQLYFLQAQEL